MTPLTAPRFVEVLKRFGADQQGATAVVTGLWLTGMLGFAGLATQGSLWYVTQRNMQGAADAGAYSAAIALAAGEDSTQFTTEAQSVAGTYNYVNGSGATVTVNNPPASGPNTSNSSAIEVIISQSQPLMLAGLFLSAAPTIQARAVAATNVSGSGCVLSLDKAAVSNDADNLSGNADLTLGQCSLYINSPEKDALNMSGNASVTAKAAFVTGDDQLSGNATLGKTPLTTGVPPAPDPYAGVSIPSYNASCPPALTNYSLSGNSSATINASGSTPTVFCGGLNLSANSTLTLGAGTYIINGGTLGLSGNATLNATSGTTIILTGNGTSGYASLNISGNANLYIQAPSSGSLAGLAIFQDRSATGGTNSFSGNGNLNIVGAAYFPNEPVNFSGNASTAPPNGTASTCTQLIALTLTFSGNSNISNSNCSGTGVASIGGSVGIIE
jgi:Flp pilus assembly protein TadG